MGFPWGVYGRNLQNSQIFSVLGLDFGGSFSLLVTDSAEHWWCYDSSRAAKPAGRFGTLPGFEKERVGKPR
jgi:hypothetical protein